MLSMFFRLSASLHAISREMFISSTFSGTSKSGLDMLPDGKKPFLIRLCN